MSTIVPITEIKEIDPQQELKDFAEANMITGVIRQFIPGLPSDFNPKKLIELLPVFAIPYIKEAFDKAGKHLGDKTRYQIYFDNTRGIVIQRFNEDTTDITFNEAPKREDFTIIREKDINAHTLTELILKLKDGKLL